MKVGIIGLGSMGGGAARACVAAGLVTQGHDIAEAAMRAFAAEGGQAAATPGALAAQCDAVAVYVLNADQTEAALFDSGAAAAARPGTVFLLCATMPPARATAIAERRVGMGHLALDAPVSGGAAKARAGALTIMASGSEAAFARASVMLDAMAAQVFRLGPEPGMASRMKIVNQHLAGIHIAAAAEALTQAIALGMDPAQVIEVIADCAGTSWMFENRGPHIAQGDYTPLSAVEIWLKDLAIVVDIATEVGLDPVLARAALARFRAAAEAGFGREDDAAVAKVYARAAGLALPGVA